MLNIKKKLYQLRACLNLTRYFLVDFYSAGGGNGTSMQTNGSLGLGGTGFGGNGLPVLVAVGSWVALLLLTLITWSGYIRRYRSEHPNGPPPISLFRVYTPQESLDQLRALFTTQANPQLERARWVSLGLWLLTVFWLFAGVLFVHVLRILIELVWTPR